MVGGDSKHERGDNLQDMKFVPEQRNFAGEWREGKKAGAEVGQAWYKLTLALVTIE